MYQTPLSLVVLFDFLVGAGGEAQIVERTMAIQTQALLVIVLSQDLSM